MRVRDVPEDEESSSHYTLTSLSTGSEGILMADRRIVLYIAGVFVCCTGAAALVSRQRVKKSDVMPGEEWDVVASLAGHRGSRSTLRTTNYKWNVDFFSPPILHLSSLQGNPWFHLNKYNKYNSQQINTSLWTRILRICCETKTVSPTH